MNKWMTYGAIFALAYYLGTKRTLAPVTDRLSGAATALGITSSSNTFGAEADDTNTDRASESPGAGS